MAYPKDTNIAKTRSAQPTSSYKLAQRIEPYLLLLPALIILVLFFLGPALYNIWLSFHRLSLFELRDGGSWTGIGNYPRYFRNPTSWRALINTTLWLTGATVALRLLFGLGLALLLNAPVLRRWRLIGVARSLLLIPWITPPVVAVATWRWLLHGDYGVINHLLIQAGILSDGIPFFVRISTVWGAIIAIVVWRELPFVVLSLIAGLQSIPVELYEAAKIDGAGGLSLFRYITLPLLKPVIAIVTMLTVIWTYNNFVYVWLSTQGGPGDATQVLATQVYTEAFVNYRLGLGATIGVIMSLIMFIFAILYFYTVFRKSLGQT